MFGISSFDPERNVSVMKLLDLLDWTEQSEAWMVDRKKKKPDHGVLALPPLQRSAVWNPKQIVDLWDSVLRGLPIGSIYLLKRKDNGTAKGIGLDAGNTDEAGEGWDILDGQQRLRTLFLGLRGPSLKSGATDKRCLWVDVMKNGDYRLRLTTESQPFGYDPTSQAKMSLGNRQKARTQVEPIISNPIMRIEHSRVAYNYELFEGFIKSDVEFKDAIEKAQAEPLNKLLDRLGWKKTWPPLPYNTGTHKAYPLHVVLAAWMTAAVSNRRDALQKIFSSGDQNETLVYEIDRAFSSLIDAEIAIFNVKLPNPDQVLLLFSRIGSGGTPLTGEEMLFSIYKFHEPKIHDTVNALYNDGTVGRALPPTKIAAAAIRIANALSHINHPNAGNWLPSVGVFSSAMSERESEIRKKLDELLAINAENAKFTAAFRLLFKTLAWRTAPSDNGMSDPGLPKVMMVTLSPRLLEVLLLWIITDSKISIRNIELERADILKFVMFWRLCVINEDKASNFCFVKIKINRKENEGRLLPLVELFDAIIGANERVSIPLVDPKTMKGLLCSYEPGHVWRTYNERFPAEPNPQSVMARLWWNSGKSTLIWLQRAYLQSRFPDFDPASGRDDDTPYDADHMVPAGDWGRNWAYFSKADNLPELTRDEREAIRDPRFLLGNSIGNLRLIDAAVNKSEQDDPYITKIIEELRMDKADEMSVDEKSAYHSSMAFRSEAMALWRRASGAHDQVWPNDRLKAFQQAVEERAAWLYDKFYSDLGFVSWQDRVVIPPVH